MTKFVSSPENLAIIEALIERLESLPVGATLNNQTVHNLCQGKKHLIYRAREIVEKRQGCAFATVRGVGVKKLQPEKASTLGQKARESAARRIGKSKGVMVIVFKSNEDMDRAARLKLQDEISRCSLVQEFLKD